MKRSRVNMWEHLTCPNCGSGYVYERGAPAPDPKLAGTFTTRRMCSLACAEAWVAATRKEGN